MAPSESVCLARYEDWHPEALREWKGGRGGVTQS